MTRHARVMRDVDDSLRGALSVIYTGDEPASGFLYFFDMTIFEDDDAFQVDPAFGEWALPMNYRWIT